MGETPFFSTPANNFRIETKFVEHTYMESARTQLRIYG